jgi:hypothetical protein
MTDAELRALAEAATPGPYFAASDDAEECGPHRNSGLSLVDTGRREDWPIARLCESPSAAWIAATDPQTILALLDRLAAAERDAATDKENAHWLRCWGDSEMARGNVSNAQRFIEIADSLDAAMGGAE